MKLDGYNIVNNHEETFSDIAQTLLNDYAVVFPWTDGHGTREDILMVYKPVQYGSLGGGQNASHSLFVSVLRVGAFGFRLGDDPLAEREKHPEYVGKKLNMGGHNETTAELAELINGVIKYLQYS